MPAYRDREARKLYMRQYRAKKKSKIAAASAAAKVVPLVLPDDPVGALAAWARETLIVPRGHPLAGEPMALPHFAVDFLRAGWGAHESALTMARKNGKSAICAVLALGHLVGPLRTDGLVSLACAVVVSKEKAAELRHQCAAIAEASKLDVVIRSSPYPGKIISSTGTLETLASERTAGHSSSFDLVVVDETGLMPERSRELLAGLRSSVSAKGGRIMHISVRGDSALFAEVLDNSSVVSRVYAAPPGSALDDREAWAAANPALGTIKQLDYLVTVVERSRA